MLCTCCLLSLNHQLEGGGRKAAGLAPPPECPRLSLTSKEGLCQFLAKTGSSSELAVVGLAQQGAVFPSHTGASRRAVGGGGAQVPCLCDHAMNFHSLGQGRGAQRSAHMGVVVELIVVLMNHCIGECKSECNAWMGCCAW